MRSLPAGELCGHLRRPIDVMKTRHLAILMVLSVTGCSTGPARVTLDQITTDPREFDVGERVALEGFAIRPRASVTFLCNELDPDRPPSAKGRCVEVEGVPLTKAGRDRHVDGVWWDEEKRELDCIVVRRMPIHTDPERVVLSCVPLGSRP